MKTPKENLFDQFPTNIQQGLNEFEENNDVELDVGYMTSDGEQAKKIIILSPLNTEDIVLTIPDLKNMLNALEFEP